MKRGPTRNLSASVRTRLLSLAHGRGEDYQRVLGRYAIERFLYRLGRSNYRDKFALNGATLFTLWTGQTHRPTKDLDLLGRGLSSTTGFATQSTAAINSFTTGRPGRTNGAATELVSFDHRLRSVRYARADSDVLRTSSNRVRSRSVCVSPEFEYGMTSFVATA